MPIHEDQREANRAGLQAFNTGVMLGLTDALLAPAITVQGPLATSYTSVVSALKVHEDQQGALRRVNKAAIAMQALGVYSDTFFASVSGDTAAGVRAQHLAQDAALNVAPSTLTQQGGILFGE